MLIRYADWKKPTDDAFAFALRAPDEFSPVTPAIGTRRDIREIAREVFAADAADRFEAKVQRWSGPEDVVDGRMPYGDRQLFFAEAGALDRLSIKHVESVLCGCVLVARDAQGRVNYVLRDHHMIDVALYHYGASGELPRRLFHVDRHSDYCRDSFLGAKTPDQAATWWKLFEGLKRPDGEPVLREEAVVFAHAKATHEPWMSGRDMEGPLVMPGALASNEITWQAALEKVGEEVDWVSIDLDGLQPSPQLRLTEGMLRDRRFHRLMSEAKVRVFVLSPQFTNGGDRFSDWKIHGSRWSSLRLLNLLRREWTPRSSATLRDGHAAR